MTKGVCVVVALLLLNSCIEEYYPGDDFWNKFEKKVVVNGLLCADSCIQVNVCWSRRTNDTTAYRPVVGSFVSISEDGEPLFSDTLRDMVLRLPYRARAGSWYAITVKVPEEREVSAHTYVPHAAIGNIQHRNFNNEYDVFSVERLQPNDKTRALWLTGRRMTEEGEIRIFSEIYCNSPFPDPINSATEQMDVADRESNVLYESFIRLPINTLSSAIPLKFSVTTHYSRREVVMTLITPSDEYDKYFRSEYKQFLYAGSSDNPLLYDRISVFSNVKNGVGIFAGYSVMNMVYAYPNSDEE